jgi:hypothetical protein
MQSVQQLAYSLSQAEAGWTWHVYDENGDTVASGADSDRQAAQDAVNATLHAAE